MVIDEERPQSSPLSTGLTAGAETRNLSGLSEGQLVILKNAATITAGQAIEALSQVVADVQDSVLAATLLRLRLDRSRRRRHSTDEQE